MTARIDQNYSIAFEDINTPNATAIFTYAGDAYPRETFKANDISFHYDTMDPLGKFTIHQQSHSTEFRASKCTSPAHTGVADLVDQIRAIADQSGVGINVTVTNFPNPQNVSVVNFPATQPVSGTVAVSNLLNPHPVTGTVGVTQVTNPWVTSGSVSVTNLLNPHPVTGTVTANQGSPPWAVNGTVAVSNLLNPHPVSGTVAVSNFPATQPVSGTVAVSNFPATQPVSGTVTANQGTTPWVTTSAITPAIPATADIVGGSRTTTGTLYTVPAGRTFFGSLSLACSISLAGSNNPNISIAGAGIAPAAGTIFQIQNTGLALVSVTSANTLSDVYIYGGAAGATVTFTAGGSGTSVGQIAGRLL